MPIALTRAVPRSINRCELSHVERQPIDFVVASRQHSEYDDALRAAGCTVEEMPALDDFPDSVFVEDTAIVLDEVAIITRPGAESRRGETSSTASALRRYRELAFIEAPATIDGGDVLRIGRQIFVGLSDRTSSAALEQLRAIVLPHGYEVIGVPMRDCLHLKTAVTEVAPGTLLINPRWVSSTDLGAFDFIEVDAREPFGGNALMIGDAVIYAREHEATAEKLERRGIRLHRVPASELAKAEGGVTCCSVIFRN